MHLTLRVHEDTLVLFFKAASQLDSPKHTLVPEVIRPQVQDFALPPVDLHKIAVSPFLQPI